MVKRGTLIAINSYYKSDIASEKISHNAPFITEVCTRVHIFVTLWDTGLVHCGICEINQLSSNVVKHVVIIDYISVEIIWLFHICPYEPRTWPQCIWRLATTLQNAISVVWHLIWLATWLLYNSLFRMTTSQKFALLAISHNVNPSVPLLVLFNFLNT